MSKKLIDTSTFLSRTSSHSMTGYRRGYLEILPPWAEIRNYSENKLMEIRQSIMEELENIKQIEKKRGLNRKKWKILKNRRDSLRGMLGNINKTLCLQNESFYDNCKAWVWMRVAKERLEHNFVRNVDIEADSIMFDILSDHIILEVNKDIIDDKLKEVYG